MASRKKTLKQFQRSGQAPWLALIFEGEAGAERNGNVRSVGWSFQGRTFSSVAQLCPTLCDPMDCSLPGLPVHHQLPDLTQTHVHWVSDAIQPSHPLSSPSPSAFSLSQQQGHYQWVSSDPGQDIPRVMYMRTFRICQKAIQIFVFALHH